MRSALHGKRTSVVEVTNVSRHGFWLLLEGRELFLAFQHFPWFRDASIAEVCNVERPHPHHLHWPEIDVDLALLALGFVGPQREGLLADLDVRLTDRGTVAVDEPNGQPLRRVTVATSLRTGGALTQFQTTTDDKGQFVLPIRPAGTYSPPSAGKGGFVSTSYGEKRPQGVGTPITLAEGQRLTIALKMLRGAVITGTLQDNGRPVAQVSVARIHRRQDLLGRLSQLHLRRMKYRKPWLSLYVRRRLGEVCDLNPVKRPAMGAARVLQVAAGLAQRDVERRASRTHRGDSKLQGHSRLAGARVTLQEVESTLLVAAKQHVVQSRYTRGQELPDLTTDRIG